MALFVEVSGLDGSGGQRELPLSSTRESVPLRDGAALHVVHQPGERLIFSLANLNGKKLCSWEPSVIFTNKRARDFHGFALTDTIFRNTEEPVWLSFGHEFSDGLRKFSIDGLPARVLMESPYFVILRDPNPIPGVRTLETEGQTATLRFVTVDPRMRASPDGDNVEIDLRGLPLRRGWRAAVILINLNPRAATFKRARPVHSTEVGESTYLWIPRGTDGSVTLNCRIQARQPGRIDLNDFTAFVAQEPAPRLIPFVPRLLF